MQSVKERKAPNEEANEKEDSRGSVGPAEDGATVQTSAPKERATQVKMEARKEEPKEEAKE